MRIVVVGAGMVGHRLADELVRADPGADVVLLGEEEYEPYNRVMLSELVAGRVDLAGLALPSLPAVDVRLGSPVRDVDLARRTVLTTDDEIGYDHLVLATGARARVLPLPGLQHDDGSLVGGAHVLRGVDDAREVVAGALNARQVVVVGAGPIGVEVACGLRHRGAAVSLVVTGTGVLNRDLDAGVGEVAATTVRDLGIELVTQADVVAVEVRDAHVAGLRLGDGRRVAADLLVLATGSVPDTRLAARAGLATGRGIVVDAALRTSDPYVSAIGDCAETPAGLSGLVAPGWAQARTLARHLARGDDVEPLAVDGAAMRLKAVGLSVVTAGARASTADPADRVLAVDDRGARRHVEVVVRQRTLVGFTCVGAPELAARLSTQLDRPGIAPTDPLHLLVGTPEDEAASPTAMPSATTICRCNGVTKGDLVHAWDAGCTSVEAIADATLATTGCGGCGSLVRGLLDWLAAADPPVSQPADAGRETTVPTG